MNESTTLLILGASGDLTARLLLPGLGSMLTVEPDRRVEVLGADRVELDDGAWRDTVRTALTDAEVPEATVTEIADAARYQTTDLLEQDQLRALLDTVDRERPLVIYFALPPQVTVKVCDLLKRIDLPEQTRLALEKPFGADLESARELNAELTTVAPEERIHRIDHFLGVDTVLNLVGLRFANRLLQPVWSQEHIQQVVIRYDESLALEGRAGYYDHAGALVDMIQSHLLQVLSVFAMESPAALDAEELRSLKAQAMRAVSLWTGDPATSSRRARYTAGSIDGREVPDYVAEDGVDPERDTETLAELVLKVENARWAGVPFILRSGKALGEAAKRIEVTFRPPVHVPDGLKGPSGPDMLVLQLKPGAVTLQLTMNAEGDPFQLEQKQMSVELGTSRMLPYGEVLAGIIDGDPLLSIRGDVAEECWRVVEPVLDAWHADQVPLQEYAAGSSGPDGWGRVGG